VTLLFGGFAIREHRRERELRRELAVQELQREAAERLARADKLATLGALATGIAHELSTPLSVIDGRAQQVIASGVLDPKGQSALTIVRAEVDRTLAIIAGFLGLARGESPRLQCTDPKAIARSCCDLVGHRFEQAGVTLTMVADDPLPRVACDRRLLEQAIVNLLLNACDACVRGSNVDFRVAARGCAVVFQVDDDGEGITAAAAARATEPFFTTKKVGEGTGLGLAIASEIVKYHQGKLTIAPRTALTNPAGRRGTCARIEVPKAPEAGHA
jgi:signal transduction histidine kinase